MATQLRFRSEIIGEAPSDWGKAKVDDDLVEVLGGFACAKKYAVPAGVPHLRPFNITTNGEVVLTEDTVQIPHTFRDDLEDYYLLPGDVLYNNTNSVELVGKTGIVRRAMHVAFSNHINRLRVKDLEQLDPRWLALSLQSLQRQGFFAARCNRWIGQAGFSAGALSDVEIPLPDKATQDRIIARIETLFREVWEMQGLNRQIITSTGRLMDATLAQVFASEAVQDWTSASSLGEVAEISAPLVDPTLPEYRDLPHIYGRVVEEGTGRLLDYNTAAEDGMRSGKYLFKAGAVLYSKIRPYLRKVTLVDFDGLCSADMYPLQVKSEVVLPEFLMWALLSPDFTEYANSLSGRARIPKLNREQLFAYQLRYPTRKTQERIDFHLQQVRSETVDMLELCENDTKLLTQMEQAILAQAFRGEL